MWILKFHIYFSTDLFLLLDTLKAIGLNYRKCYASWKMLQFSRTYRPKLSLGQPVERKEKVSKCHVKHSCPVVMALKINVNPCMSWNTIGKNLWDCGWCDTVKKIYYTLIFISCNTIPAELTWVFSVTWGICLIKIWSLRFPQTTQTKNKSKARFLL